MSGLMTRMVNPQRHCGGRFVKQDEDSCLCCLISLSLKSIAQCPRLYFESDSDECHSPQKDSDVGDWYSVFSLPFSRFLVDHVDEVEVDEHEGLCKV